MGCDVILESKEVLEHYAGKRVLITGGAGCIGSNLVKTLLKAEPEKIVVIDDLSSSYEWNLPEDARATLVKGSILDEEKMKSAFGSRPRFVFHLAAHFANQNSVDHPETDDSFKYPGMPYKFSCFSLNQWKRAPLIGEDNIKVYQKQLGLSEKELERLSSIGVI